MRVINDHTYQWTQQQIQSKLANKRQYDRSQIYSVLEFAYDYSAGKTTPGIENRNAVSLAASSVDALDRHI